MAMTIWIIYNFRENKLQVDCACSPEFLYACDTQPNIMLTV